MPYATEWFDKLQKCVGNTRPPLGVFCGYNAHIDYIEYLEEELLAPILQKNMTSNVFQRIKANEFPNVIQTPEDFLVALCFAVNSGKSVQIKTDNEEMLPWFNRNFDQADEHRIGGQTGIIANLLGRLGVKTIIFIPNLSPAQRRYFYKENIFFPLIDLKSQKIYLQNASKIAQSDQASKINWIFEYEKKFTVVVHEDTTNLVYKIIAPRSNRFIVADATKNYIPQLNN